MAVDGLGNLYVADTLNNRVRRVDASGTITTVAGTGTADFGGDGGPGTSAALQRPHGVAVDGVGNIYIADTSNNRVRRVDPSGTITTVAGTGTAGYSGDGGPAESALFRDPRGLAVDTLGHLYVADTENDRIRRIRLNQGGTSGPSPADPYTPLDEWTVADNRLQFTILATRHCFPVTAQAPS